jgi:translation elongation factor P/translation initiation factor 5A
MLILMVALVVGFGFVGQAWASTVSGKLLKIEGSVYVIQDEQSGEKHQVRVDQSTRKEGEIKEGAMVEVQIDDLNDRVVSIKEKKT